MQRTLPTFLAFGLSGLASLVYQVTWQRLLALQTGIGLESVTLIVAAFMLGLGAGGLLGGIWSRRLTSEAALSRFVLLELGIAGFGALSPFLYYDVLYLRGAWLYADPLAAGLLHFASLLPPTLLMGMSLPLLTRALVREGRHAARVIGCLYAVNVLGASLGALLAPWWLIRFYGIRAALGAAAVANVTAALLAAAAALAPATRDGSQPQGEPEAPEGAPAGVPYRAWLLLYGVSGFVALSLEILWFRIFDLAVKATAFTFGTVLCCYLLGLASGSLAGAIAAPRWREPLRVFLLCQIGIVVYAAASVTALALLPESWPGLSWYVELWRGHRSFNLSGRLVSEPLARLYLALPLFLFGPSTFLMGLSFPALQRAAQGDARGVGFRIGQQQAVNIAGCVLGSLLTGLVLLSRFGTASALRGLLLVALVAFVVPGLRYGGRRGAFVASAAALVVAMLALPSSEVLWRRLHGLTDQTALLAEDATGVVLLEQRPPRWLVWVDGKTNSSLPFGGTHTLLGALPSLVHPEPRQIAVIGLTSGDTAWAAGCRSGTERVRVFECVAPQLPLLRRLAEVDDLPKLPRFLRDARYQVLTADGRHALQRAEPVFDVIVIDGPRPSTAYSGGLYAVEFFELCARRLAPGGIVSAWTPTSRIAASFRSAFPHVLELPGEQVMLGRMEPFAEGVALGLARLDTADVVGYLSPDRAAAVQAALLRLKPPTGPRPTDADVNHDLFPRDEFNTPG